jgi:hypothetical protein
MSLARYVCPMNARSGPIDEGLEFVSFTRRSLFGIAPWMQFAASAGRN